MSPTLDKHNQLGLGARSTGHYDRANQIQDVPPPFPVICPSATSIVAIGAASAASGALTASLVRLAPTVDCHVRFGVVGSTTALSTDMILFAGQSEYFNIKSGQCVAVIHDALDGNLYITTAL